MGTLTEGRMDEVGDSGTFLKILCVPDRDTTKSSSTSSSQHDKTKWIFSHLDQRGREVRNEILAGEMPSPPKKPKRG